MIERIQDDRLRIILEHLEVMPDNTRTFHCTRHLVRDLRSICAELQERREKDVRK